MFGGFGALQVVGGGSQGYQQGKLQQQQIDTGDINAQAQAAAGRAFQAMVSPVPGAQPMQPQQNPIQALLARIQGAGGQPPQGQPQPPQGMPQGPMQGAPSPGPSQPMQGGMPPQGPPQGGMPPQMQQAPVPGAQPMQRPPMPGMPPPQGASPMSGGQPGMPPQGGGAQPGPPQGMPQQQGGMGGAQGGPLDWRTVVQKVVQANPGVKDPRVIAAAVNQFMPLMTAQSLMEWRQIQAQVKQEMVPIAQQRADAASTQAGASQQRADTGAAMVPIQQEKADTAKSQGQQRIDVSKQREERIGGQALTKNDQAYQRLDLAKQQLQRQIIQGNNRQMLGQWRAVVDAQHKRAQEIISSQAAGMPDAERKKMIDEENKFYESQIKEMRTQIEGTKSSFGDRFGGEGDSSKGDAQPAKVTSPEEAQKLKPGTQYVTPDGQTYTR